MNDLEKIIEDETMCVNLEMLKGRFDTGMEWLGCYSCDGHRTDCMGYLTKEMMYNQ
jgi:hypothetical protein